MRRIGETFASNLDRDALLEIVVRTAVDGVGADGGPRALRAATTARCEERVAPGELGGTRARSLPPRREAQALATPATPRRQVGERQRAGATRCAAPRRRRRVARRRLGRPRASRPFTDGERELFGYLAGQAAVSLENVDLHETVERQAVTDELTGLFNHRRFQEVLAAEVERARSASTSALGLVMLDIDNFKRVNDTYGHQQGDLVLREVARVLRDTSREIDEPARYGGEELAVVAAADRPRRRLRPGRAHARRRSRPCEFPRLDGSGVLG